MQRSKERKRSRREKSVTATMAAAGRLVAQIREQTSGPDLHVFKLKFLALKKTGFSPIKNTF